MNNTNFFCFIPPSLRAKYEFNKSKMVHSPPTNCIYWQLEILATALGYICLWLNYKTDLFAWWGESYVALGIQYYCTCSCPCRHCGFNQSLCGLLPFYLSYVAISWSCEVDSCWYFSMTGPLPCLRDWKIPLSCDFFKMIWPFLCFTLLVFRYPLLTAIYNVCFEKHPPSEMIEVLKRHL